MTGAMSREEAETRHRESIGYTAVLGDPKKPHCFLEASLRGVGFVSYFDEHTRPYISYGFMDSEERSGLLFLSSVIQWEYAPGTSMEVTHAVSYRFFEDGKVSTMESDVPKKVNTVTEGRADLSDHFVRIPAFGEYGDFVRRREVRLISRA